MVWVVDKKIVRHLITRDRKMIEVPVRVTFEYQLEDNELVEKSLTTKVIYNEKGIAKIFPGIDLKQTKIEVNETVDKEIREHIAIAAQKMKISRGEVD